MPLQSPEAKAAADLAVTQTLNLALKVAREVCTRGHDAGCVMIGRVYHLPRTPIHDLERALNQWRAGCKQKSIASCGALATALKSRLAPGDREAAEAARAVAYDGYGRACNQGQTRSCRLRSNYHPKGFWGLW